MPLSENWRAECGRFQIIACVYLGQRLLYIQSFKLALCMRVYSGGRRETPKSALSKTIYINDNLAKVMRTIYAENEELHTNKLKPIMRITRNAFH